MIKKAENELLEKAVKILHSVATMPADSADGAEQFWQTFCIRTVNILLEQSRRAQVTISANFMQQFISSSCQLGIFQNCRFYSPSSCLQLSHVCNYQAQLVQLILLYSMASLIISRYACQYTFSFHCSNNAVIGDAAHLQVFFLQLLHNSRTCLGYNLPIVCAASL